MRICKTIMKHKKLTTVLHKCGISDYLEIQDILGSGVLYFSDTNMDENTEIFLSNEAVEEIETHRELTINKWITRIVAIWGGVTGTIAILIELTQLSRR